MREIKPKDILGQELNVGDRVLFMQIKYRNYIEGVIKSLSPKSAIISHEKTNLCSTESRQKYEQLISLTAHIESQRREKAAIRALTNHVRWNECCEFCNADCTAAGLEEMTDRCDEFVYNAKWRGPREEK